MNRVRRTAAATVAAAALALAPATAGIADAAPHSKASKAQAKSKVKSQVKQVLNDIRGKDRALARVSVSRTVTRLADEHEEVLVDSIGLDREELSALRDEAAAADSTYDAKSVRKEVKAFRVEIFTQAAGIVREAERLTVEAAEDAEALELVDLAIDAALALTSKSPKADVAVARQYLEDAEAELDDVDEAPDSPEGAETPESPETPAEPVV